MSIALLGGITWGGGDDGIKGGDGGVGEAQIAQALTLTVPTCADKGTTVSIQTSHATVDPLVSIVILRQPTSGPPFHAEVKVNKRIYEAPTSGALHVLYIDTWGQIGGTAEVHAFVQGVGSANATFVIPCPPQ